MTTRTEPWNLESFLDSLILELDKAQDTLSVKGITRKLTYTVQDVALDLQIFPHFDSGKVQFSAAQPGESGSSKLSIKLGSITDRQIRETTRDPFKVDDVAIETIDELDDETKDNLQRKGIHTASDLERLEQRNVDVEKVVKDKAGTGKSYKSLANLINRARRRNVPPSISSVQSVSGENTTDLTLEGKNLAMAAGQGTFPAARIDDVVCTVKNAGETSITLSVPNDTLRPGVHRLQVALDPYAFMVLNINT